MSGVDTVITFNSSPGVPDPTTTLRLVGVSSSSLKTSDFIFNGQVAITVQTQDGCDFSTLYADIAGSTVQQDANNPSGEFTATNAAAGLIFDVHGTGFHYTGGHPDGGTVNGIDIYDSSWHILATTNGWSFTATSLSSAIQTYNTANSHDGSGFDSIFGTVSYSDVGTGGADTFFSGGLADVFIGLPGTHGPFDPGGDTVD